jgi:hypothetical protein
MAGPAISREPDIPSLLVEGTLWFALVSGALFVVTLSALSSLMLAHTLHDLVTLPRSAEARPAEAVVEPACPAP